MALEDSYVTTSERSADRVDIRYRGGERHPKDDWPRERRMRKHRSKENGGRRVTNR
jgi:hypothetical protein